MKKNILFVFLFSASMAFSQVSYGVRAGFNYGSMEGSELGYNVGLQTKIDFPGLYLMPELVYSKLKGSYKSNGKSVNVDLQKIDLPISLGFKFLKFFSVFGGPGLQYIIDTSSADYNIEDIQNDLSLIANIGVGFNISNFGINLRYETGLSKNNISLLDKLTNLNLPDKVNASPRQVILTFAFYF